MSMSERVAQLRQQSLDAIPTLSPERAELMTEFYRQDLGPEAASAPVRRALAFRYLMLRDSNPTLANQYAADARTLLMAAVADDPQAEFDAAASNNHSMYAYGTIPTGIALVYLLDGIKSDYRRTCDVLVNGFQLLYKGFHGPTIPDVLARINLQ